MIFFFDVGKDEIILKICVFCPGSKVAFFIIRSKISEMIDVFK